MSYDTITLVRFNKRVQHVDLPASLYIERLKQCCHTNIKNRELHQSTRSVLWSRTLTHHKALQVQWKVQLIAVCQHHVSDQIDIHAVDVILVYTEFSYKECQLLTLTFDTGLWCNTFRWTGSMCCNCVPRKTQCPLDLLARWGSILIFCVMSVIVEMCG